MATVWTRKYQSYQVQIDPETGLAVRISITAQVVADGETRTVTAPDEGQYVREDLGIQAMDRLDDFTADVIAKYNADNPLPAS